MNIIKIIILLFLIVFSYPLTGYSAMDFEGAIIEFKDVPTRAWKYGVLGNKWIVSIVKDKSHAKLIGLKQGDIILTVDDKNLVSIDDLLEMSYGEHAIKVLNTKNQVDNLVINRMPPKPVNTPKNRQDLNLPSIAVNDEVLAQKYGKTETKNKQNKRSYRDCIDDELANASTYEHYINKPNARGGDYGRAQRICDEEFGRRTGITVERLY
ncbi:MAG: hypothetical protein JJE30_16795 [Desulfuromonadales bacterium]|nr:hypothetical protein [Desulfuromonadales bacterium]